MRHVFLLFLVLEVFFGVWVMQTIAHHAGYASALVECMP